MRGRAPSICCVGGCPEFAVKAGRCEDHQRKAWRTQSASSQQLNGNSWARARRRAIRRAGGICEIPTCAEKAVEVHHLVRLADGGDVYDQSNLQALCATHHKQHHRR